MCIRDRVAVGRFENALEVVEAEAGIGGESAYDAEANALVNQTVEFGELESAGGDALASRSCGLGSGFWLAALGEGSSPVSYTHLDVYKRQRIHRGVLIRDY